MTLRFLLVLDVGHFKFGNRPFLHLSPPVSACLRLSPPVSACLRLSPPVPCCIASALRHFRLAYFIVSTSRIIKDERPVMDGHDPRKRTLIQSDKNQDIIIHNTKREVVRTSGVKQMSAGMIIVLALKTACKLYRSRAARSLYICVSVQTGHPKMQLPQRTDLFMTCFPLRRIALTNPSYFLGVYLSRPPYIATHFISPGNSSTYLTPNSSSSSIVANPFSHSSRTCCFHTLYSSTSTFPVSKSNLVISTHPQNTDQSRSETRKSLGGRKPRLRSVLMSRPLSRRCWKALALCGITADLGGS
jgi:hypothetical protein